MPRQTTSINDLATAALRSTDRDQQKIAASTYTPNVKSETGVGLVKLATELRRLEKNEIDWSDVAEYRENHGY